MKTGIFITGTNTDIGKTFVSSLLLSAALQQGMSARYFKPLQTGTSSDCDTVKSLTQVSEDRIVRPVYSFPTPVTPYLAAQIANSEIEINKILKTWHALPEGCYIVEGAGGLMVPVWRNLLMRDVIKQLQLPLLIVASTVLGTMNHTLLTVEAARAVGIEVKGIILSGPTSPGLTEILTEFSDVKILAEIPWLEKVDATNFSQQAATLMTSEQLTEVFGCEH